MAIPVVPADFEATIVTPTGSVCDELKGLFSIAEKLTEAWTFMFDSAGNPTPAFLALFASVGVPVGGVIFWPAATFPSGFLIANGQEISKTTYSNLYAVYADQYGAASNSANFKLPDYRGYVLAGADTGSFPFNPTGSLGAATVALDATQIPAHTHPVKFASQGESETMTHWSYDSGSPDGTRNEPMGIGPGVITDTMVAAANTGGGQPHSNIQPTKTGYWLVKF